MNKPSLWATVIKIFVALLFLIMAPDMEGDTIAVSLVIGLAFLSWALLPYRRYKLEMKEAEEGRKSAVKRPKLGSAIAKVTFAALFAIMAFSMDDLSSLLISIVLAGAFLLWAAIPFYQYRQEVQMAEETPNVQELDTNRAVRSIGLRICPFCGAPMAGEVCEYCGMYSKR